MDTEELQKLILTLQLSYKHNRANDIVEGLRLIILYFISDIDSYPEKVREGVSRNIEIFKELHSKASQGSVDVSEDWKKFYDAANDLAFNVFVPWLNETNDDSNPFMWVQGGDA